MGLDQNGFPAFPCVECGREWELTYLWSVYTVGFPIKSWELNRLVKVLSQTFTIRGRQAGMGRTCHVASLVTLSLLIAGITVIRQNYRNTPADYSHYDNVNGPSAMAHTSDVVLTWSIKQRRSNWACMFRMDSVLKGYFHMHPSTSIKQTKTNGSNVAFFSLIED